MYDLPYHKEHNPSRIKEFINQYPFAFLTGCDEHNWPASTQVPLFMEEYNGKKYLSGHIMKNTDHHRAFQYNSNVVAVFTGRHTYVSGTWYSNPYTASTWNYMSVHVKGKIEFLTEQALKEVLRKTTLHFEQNNQDSTTIFDNLPAAFKKRVMNAIIAFKIKVISINSVFKLSQDRDKESYLNIINKLQQQDSDGRTIAAEMKKRINEVFPNDLSINNQ